MLNKFNSNVRKLNRITPKINPNNLNDDLYITGSLLNIELPKEPRFNSNTKSNPNPTKLVNNKNIISDFHNEIFIHSARYVKRRIDAFNDNQNTLTIYNAVTDYGTEGAAADNFEVIVCGLHIPGDYTVNDVGNNVVITLGDTYIDFNNTVLDDIYVIGKLINL